MDEKKETCSLLLNGESEELEPSWRGTIGKGQNASQMSHNNNDKRFYLFIADMLHKDSSDCQRLALCLALNQHKIRLTNKIIRMKRCLLKRQNPQEFYGKEAERTVTKYLREILVMCTSSWQIDIWLERSGAFYDSKQKRGNKVVDLTADCVFLFSKGKVHAICAHEACDVAQSDTVSSKLFVTTLLPPRCFWVRDVGQKDGL